MEESQPSRQLSISFKDFNFKECLKYLNRNPNEVLHRVNIDHLRVTKALKIEGNIFIIEISSQESELCVKFPMAVPDEEERGLIHKYIVEWFDLDLNLEAFYHMSNQDPILKDIVPLYKDYRLIGVPDLFEAFCWAIMGQQVSLHVAYLMKKRFVEAYGEAIQYMGDTYWGFPEVDRIVQLSIDDLLALKLTRRKAEYIKEIALLIYNGDLSKDALQSYLHVEDVEKRLTKIRGIGSWSANYVAMRCLRYQDAFPKADVGLHNALKYVLHLEQKPSLNDIDQWAEPWRGWKAYATFYLWRTIME